MEAKHPRARPRSGVGDVDRASTRGRLGNRRGLVRRTADARGGHRSRPGAIVADVDPDAQRVAVTTSSGLCLLRDTRIGHHSEGPRPADIIDAEGNVLAKCTSADMTCPTTTAIKGAKEPFVLVGAGQTTT